MDAIVINPTPRHELSPYLYMQFAEPLGTADSSIDAAWDFVKEQWHPRALELVKQLSPTMIRWGGCISSYYHWREGVGPMPERVPMHNICWEGMFLNHVGTAEIVELAESCSAEPLFCVNFESDGSPLWTVPDQNRIGTAKEAAEWVRYCNDPDDALRISHGRKKPYSIKYWQIGNETGYDAKGFTSGQNAAKAKEFIAAMRRADPSLKLIVWGDGPNEEWRQNYDGGIYNRWARDVSEAVGDTADFVAFHNHFGGGPDYAALHGTNYRKDPDVTWERLFAATRDFEDRIRYMERSVAPYAKKLAMTEGHFILNGRHRGDLLSSWYAGVAYARCANILERHGDTVKIATLADFMGNRWQNNAIMLPTPMWFNEPGYLLPVGTIMSLFSKNMGRFALDVQTPEGIDISASRTDDRIFLHIVNIDRTHSKPISFDVKGFGNRPVSIREICRNPEEEISSMCPDLFKPHDVIPSDSYTLPPAAVAVMEFHADKTHPNQSLQNYSNYCSN